MKYTDEMIGEVMGCSVADLRSSHAKQSARLAAQLHRAVVLGADAQTVRRLSNAQRKAQQKAFPCAS